MEGQVTLRDAMPEDRQFLASLYCDTRRGEVSAWGWPAEQEEAFLNMQFEAQYRSYGTAFPRACDQIVCMEGNAIGRMLLSDSAEERRLIDIALLAAYRNRGIGTGLLRCLLRDCEMQHCSLHLQTLQGNPAARLYERLGFVQYCADQMYMQFQWVPSGH